MSSFQIAHVLKQAQSRFPEIPVLEVRLLLQYLLQVDRAWLIAHERDAIEVKDGQANIPAEFQALLKRRSGGEPLAYIVGYREFYGLKLKVTPDTLIPRADTETLVEAALEMIPTPHLPRGERGEQDARMHGCGELRVLDLGTGSGAVALAIAKHRPHAQVVAVDASAGALAVARENAQAQGITNVSFVQSDWFVALKDEMFDVIVSNPPYVEENDPHLQQVDLRFEPMTALVAGADGLDDLRVIIRQARHHLRPNGWLMLEHGYNQARAVANLMREAGFADIAHKYDLGGIERVTMGRWQ